MLFCLFFYSIRNPLNSYCQIFLRIEWIECFLVFLLRQRPQIRVVDNGPGIPDEILEQIFVPFFTTRENGSGIGLSLSRQIMRLHGGGLQVRSNPGKETVFSMIF